MPDTAGNIVSDTFDTSLDILGLLVWKNNRRRFSEKFATWDIIRKYNKDYKLIFIGDATMSPYFVTGWGTGGTLTGAGQVLKMARPGIKIITCEPTNAALLAGGEWKPHKVQGWTPDFIPQATWPLAFFV